MTPSLRDAAQSLSLLVEPDRRGALKLLATGTALALTACGPPKEQIVPYVELPEGLTPGIPQHFATALPLAGYARGVLVTSYEGRPTKIEGNPRHPASLGASDIFAQAEIMALYEPDRATAVRSAQGLSSWEAFTAALLPQMQREKARRGSGLCVFSGRLTSPTSIRQIQGLLQTFPEAQWLQYEPIHDDAAAVGASMAFGQPLTALPRFEDAAVIISLDADPLGPGPDAIRLANGFAQRRSVHSLDRFLRLYAVESHWTLTGANADERLALAPEMIGNFAIEIANAFGAGYADAVLPEPARRFASALIADLKSNLGHSIVLAGRGQTAEVHALCQWINAKLRAPMKFIAPIEQGQNGSAQALRQLADDLALGRIQTLVIIDSNPAYASPGELALGDAIAKAPFSVHFGHCDDETAERCQWRLPLSHVLESWSDLRAFDGTASIVQPLISPLYDTRNLHEFLALLESGISASAYHLVRKTWQDRFQHDFEKSWRLWLQDGVIPDTAQPPVSPPPARLPQLSPSIALKGLRLALAPDPSILDGRFSNNAWLQECPKPVTKEVWGNTLQMSSRDAAANSLVEGDIVALRRDALSIEAPISINDTLPEGVLFATLGFGRTRAGAIGTGVGFNAYLLQSASDPWVVANVSLTRTNKNKKILTTQQQFDLGSGGEEIFRSLPLGELFQGQAESNSTGLETLLPDWTYEGYQWAMVIDTSLCIGCNACAIACQSENNVPVVGPREIAKGRDMHWLRIDAYFTEGDEYLSGFQPTPCMHCEKAPCEPVCPVAASIHDSEGLNLQVYNRCVGTRFCQSNCPYKVRHFNFFGYATDQAYANLGEEVAQALFNPDVTVRARGVMEKCTYCVQRISRARRTAEKEDRRLHDGEVVTACQAACPTRAITFGDLNDGNSRINALRKEPHHYAMLGGLGTRPRTTYLARLRNPNAMHRADQP